MRVGSERGPKSPMLLMPALASRVHTAGPSRPRLVKIWITPPEASVPYSVVAAGPFTTSMRSISDAAMSLSGDTD